MHIKQVTIQGFKSYKNQTTLETFSPRHNVIVGRNGSGKSNFFWAIRFVLGDAFQNMSKEERQQLLHEGAGNATLSAFVEIVFDNSDGRFPTGKEDVTLRRTIGQKKDEYSLDKKSVTKSDVMNLLESAGFSRSNPYYIVPQGRVQTLTNAKDQERLTLLKEVAGTRVYEQRRTESLKIMEETDSKRKKIEELLEFIEERLTELEEEKEELKQFQDKDRERRSLEFTIYQRELDEVGALINQQEEDRQAKVADSSSGQKEFAAREKKIAGFEREIRELRHQLELVKNDKVEAEGDKDDAIRSRASMEMVVKDLESAAAGNEQQKASLSAELKDVDSKISSKQKELDKVLPQHHSSLQKEQEVQGRINDVDVQLKSLYEKQGRSQQFRTKDERDKWLKEEMAKIKRTSEDSEKQLKSLETDVKSTKEQLAVAEQEIQETDDRLKGRKKRLEELVQKIQELKEQRSAKMEERKDTWREQEKARANMATYKVEADKAERDLSTMMDSNTRNGIQSVRNIAARLKLNGVYGCLYELFDVQDKHRVAVEAIAGNSLFHLVVDSDATATRVLDEMKREPRHTGRVTFMPLNQLRVKEARLPPTGSDAIPMLKRLTYDSRYQKAMEQVFGKAIIVPSLDVGARYAKDEKLTAVTLDGDRAERKGALTGGYVDLRRSRIESGRNAKLYREKLEKEKQMHDEMHNKAEVMGQQITQLANELAAIDSEKGTLTGSRDPLANQMSTKTKLQASLKSRLEEQEKSLQEVAANIKNFQAQIAEYQKWMNSPMNSKLTSEEQTQLDSLTKKKADLEKQLMESQSARTKLETNRNLLEIELRGLRERRIQVSSSLERLQLTGALEDGASSGGSGGGDLASRKQELAKARKLVDNAVAKLAASEKEIERVSGIISQKEQALEQELTHQQNDNRDLERLQDDLRKFANRKAALQTRKEEWMRKIRDLGVLPEDAFQKFQNTPSSKLNKRLAAVREELKKYEHVNKKALDQYNSFTTQRDQLNERKEELDKSAEAIDDLIKVLDQRKDEAIERTFNSVKEYFGEIFEKLESKGRGELVMIRKPDDSQTQDMDEDEEETPGKSNADQYTGVAIRVSFNSKKNEALLNEQLSGGQKSLVALALIFAIQRCDPAPFYLFDEIDANLDTQYRTAVANMIKELCEEGKAQFITTTFRPEQLQVADRFYGVTFDRKVSSIHVIKQSDAINFVEQEAQAV